MRKTSWEPNYILDVPKMTVHDSTGQAGAETTEEIERITERVIEGLNEYGYLDYDPGEPLRVVVREAVISALMSGTQSSGH